MSNYRIEDGHLIQETQAPDGGVNIEMIPLGAFASRMALLGLNDPGAALDVIRAERDLDGENPYTQIYEQIFRGNSNPVRQQEQALSEFPIPMGCDNRETAEVKQMLSDEFGDALQEAKKAFIQEHLPTKEIR